MYAWRLYFSCCQHEHLQDVHKTARLFLPVLATQARGHFRWCAHCLDLTPDQDLDRCERCNQVCPLPYEGHGEGGFAGAGAVPQGALEERTQA